MTTPQPVLAVEKSGNHKTGQISVTHISKASCPSDCPLFAAYGADGQSITADDPCYASHGRQNLHTRRLNQSAERDPIALARQEAGGIDKLSGRRRLRLRVVGDQPGDTDAELRATCEVTRGAAERYTAWHGQRVYTYTHKWRQMPRAWIGDAVSILASCETDRDVRDAFDRGYAPARVMDTAQIPPAGRARGYWQAADARYVICPQQRGLTDCNRCGICPNDQRMRDKRLAVVFVSHGPNKAVARIREILSARMAHDAQETQ